MRMAFTINQPELADLLQRFESVSDDVKGNAVRSALYVGGLSQLRGMKARVRVSDDNGEHLRDHLGVERRFDRKHPIVVVGPERKWNNRAFHLEYGTKPHLIDPKGRVRNRRTNKFFTRGKKALAAPGFGPFRSVSHPGATSEPFLRPAFDAEWRRTLDLMRGVLQKHIESHLK